MIDGGLVCMCKAYFAWIEKQSDFHTVTSSDEFDLQVEPRLVFTD